MSPDQTTNADPGIEVTAKDLKTGESQTIIINNDYVLIVAGTCFLAHTQDSPMTGTRVLTVKGRGGRGGDRD